MISDRFMSADSCNALCVGDRGTIVGLVQRQELNGAAVLLCDYFEEQGRWLVTEIPNREMAKPFKVRPENLNIPLNWKLLLRLAEAGDKDARVQIGAACVALGQFQFVYKHRITFPISVSKVVNWLRSSAHRGHVESMHLLGRGALLGGFFSSMVSEEEAVLLLRKASKRGHEEAKLFSYLTAYRDGDEETVTDIVKELSTRKNPYASQDLVVAMNSERFFHQIESHCIAERWDEAECLIQDQFKLLEKADLKYAEEQLQHLYGYLNLVKVGQSTSSAIGWRAVGRLCQSPSDNTKVRWFAVIVPKPFDEDQLPVLAAVVLGFWETEGLPEPPSLETSRLISGFSAARGSSAKLRGMLTMFFGEWVESPHFDFFIRAVHLDTAGRTLQDSYKRAWSSTGGDASRRDAGTDAAVRQYESQFGSLQKARETVDSFNAKIQAQRVADCIRCTISRLQSAIALHTVEELESAIAAAEKLWTEGMVTDEIDCALTEARARLRALHASTRPRTSVSRTKTEPTPPFARLVTSSSTSQITIGQLTAPVAADDLTKREKQQRRRKIASARRAEEAATVEARRKLLQAHPRIAEIPAEPSEANGLHDTMLLATVGREELVRAEVIEPPMKPPLETSDQKKPVGRRQQQELKLSLRAYHQIFQDGYLGTESGKSETAAKSSPHGDIDLTSDIVPCFSHVKPSVRGPPTASVSGLSFVSAPAQMIPRHCLLPDSYILSAGSEGIRVSDITSGSKILAMSLNPEGEVIFTPSEVCRVYYFDKKARVPSERDLVKVQTVDEIQITLTGDHPVLAKINGAPWSAFEARELRPSHTLLSSDHRQNLLQHTVELTSRLTTPCAVIEIAIANPDSALLVGCKGGPYLAVFGVLARAEPDFNKPVARRTFLEVVTPCLDTPLRRVQSAPALCMPCVWPVPPPGNKTWSQRQPSIGSKDHSRGLCRPCRWEQRRPGVCKRGASCLFCHESHRSRGRSSLASSSSQGAM